MINSIKSKGWLYYLTIFLHILSLIDYTKPIQISAIIKWIYVRKEFILLNNDKQDQPNRSSVQVISRAAKILRTLRDHPKGLSLSQITKEVGWPGQRFKELLLPWNRRGLLQQLLLTAVSVLDLRLRCLRPLSIVI